METLTELINKVIEIDSIQSVQPQDDIFYYYGKLARNIIRMKEITLINNFSAPPMIKINNKYICGRYRIYKYVENLDADLRDEFQFQLEEYLLVRI